MYDVFKVITIFFSRLTLDFCEELFFENVVFDLLCDVGWMPAKAFVSLSLSGTRSTQAPNPSIT